jgi:hypothetical protein
MRTLKRDPRSAGAIVLLAAAILPLAPASAAPTRLAPAPRCRPAPGNLPRVGDPAVLGGQAARAALALRAAYEVDASCLRLVLADRKGLATRSAALDPYHRAPRVTILGFHHPGLNTDDLVFVERRADGTVDDVTLLHEMIHGMTSFTFRAQVRKRRVTNLLEGITEYLARKIVGERLGQQRKEWGSAYGGYVSFVEALVERIGEPSLVGRFFHGTFAELEQDASATLDPGTLGEALRALQRNDVETANAMLSRRPRPTFRARLPSPRDGTPRGPRTTP